MHRQYPQSTNQTAEQHQLKPRAIGTVQICVLNARSQEVLSKMPPQQLEHPVKGCRSSTSGKALEEKIDQIKHLQTGV